MAVAEQEQQPELTEEDARLIKRLSSILDARAANIVLWNDYYNGAHPLLYGSKKFREKFGGLFHTFHDNFCELVVDSVEERLNIDGFRIPNVPTGDDEGEPQDATAADAEAWEFWQRNALDAESQIAHTESLVKGVSYALVWADDDGEPVVTIEDAAHVAVLADPVNPRKRRAALKRWWDEDGKAYATLYTPSEIRKFVSQQTYKSAPTWKNVRWQVREVEDEVWPLDNTLGEVPIVPLPNRPRLDRNKLTSEVATVIPVQDAINKVVVDMLIAAEFASFRQRWATGIDIPTDENGQPIEPFESAVSRLWAVESEDVKFGEFSESDLSNFVKAIEMLVQHVATITRTPPHYLLGHSGTFPSGESLKATETGLVAKTRRKMRHYGEAWEEVIRLCFAVKNDPRAKVTTSETIWRDPESRTEGEHTDAVLKQAATGIPQEVLWEKLGYTATEIQRMKKLRRAEALELATAFEPVRVEPGGANAGQQPQPATA